MGQNILVTGASGLIGQRLTDLLQQKGYQVSHLSRTSSDGPVKTYTWNVNRQTMEEGALDNVDTLVHLAGAGVADKRWTTSRKQEIRESRTHSTQLLYKALKSKPNRVKALISASAIGYYGFADEDRTFTELDPPANDFIARVVREWEAEVDRITTLGIRVVKVRIGIVLSEKGGALREMAAPVRWGVGSPLASGKQLLSWIHIDDVCGIFMHAMEDREMAGAYNAVGPYAVSNEELTKKIAKHLRRPLWLPNVPAFALKLYLGEMADMVIHGNNVSSEKIKKSGYTFRYPDLDGALDHLLRPRRPA
ncbi:MAG: TIGR01777 family oxidoreductase [Cyclobacteriaceae bacterium]